MDGTAGSYATAARRIFAETRGAKAQNNYFMPHGGEAIVRYDHGRGNKEFQGIRGYRTRS